MSGDEAERERDSGDYAAEVRAQRKRLASLVADDRIPDLIRELESPQTRCRAARALGHLRERSAVPELIRLVRSSDGSDRSAAIAALGSIGDPAASEVLSEQLRSAGTGRDPACATLFALGKIGDPAAVPDMLPFLESADAIVRRTALVALVLIGDEPSASRARDLIGRLSRRRRRRVEQAIESARLEMAEATERRAYARHYYAEQARGDGGALRAAMMRPPDMSPSVARLLRVGTVVFLLLLPLIIAIARLDSGLSRLRRRMRGS